MDKSNKLSKQSCSDDIRAYFEGVLKVAKSGNEFPINLDDVWPLVFSRKDSAIRELKESFFQDVDYQVFPKNRENSHAFDNHPLHQNTERFNNNEGLPLNKQLVDNQVSHKNVENSQEETLFSDEFLRQNPQNTNDNQSLPQNREHSKGGRPSVDYYISLSCLEYFIARKVRAVFEVYRNVFHNTAKMAQLAGAKDANQVFDYMSHPTKSSRKTPSKKRVDATMAWIKGLTEVFSLDAVSQQKMYNKFAEDYDLPLLDYVKAEDGRESITRLLEMYGIKMSAQEANRRLEAAGYLSLHEYNKKGGKVGHYYIVTEKGKIFGDNYQDEHSPKKTQPLWFVGKFADLVQLFN